MQGSIYSVTLTKTKNNTMRKIGAAFHQYSTPQQGCSKADCSWKREAHLSSMYIAFCGEKALVARTRCCKVIAMYRNERGYEQVQSGLSSATEIFRRSPCMRRWMHRWYPSRRGDPCSLGYISRAGFQREGMCWVGREDAAGARSIASRAAL